MAAEGLALALATPLGGALGARADRRRARDRLDELEFELPLAGGDQPVRRRCAAEVAGLLSELLPADDPRGRVRAAAARSGARQAPCAAT